MFLVGGVLLFAEWKGEKRGGSFYLGESLASGDNYVAG